MRRSAAPSASLAKKPKFQTPFIVNRAIQREELIQNEHETDIGKELITATRHNENFSTKENNSIKDSSALHSSLQILRQSNNATQPSRFKGIGLRKVQLKTESCHSQRLDNNFVHGSQQTFLPQGSSACAGKISSIGSAFSSNESLGNAFGDVQEMKELLREDREASVTTAVPQAVGTSKTEDKHFYYSVMWCKFSKKKHKKWEGDAFLIACGRSVTLKDTEGKDIGKGTGYKASELASLDEGHTLAVGGKEIEVMSRIPAEQWESGQCFLGNVSDQPLPPISKPLHRPRLKKGFSNPMDPKSVQKPKILEVKPYHDPSAKGALLMPPPSQVHQWENNPACLPVVDVVVDPLLSKHLRPHQREGVMFLYECVLGMRDYNGLGCILADDMGLGKTLQCITLIWTLYKQGMYGGKPVVRRVIIVTPGSLVKNWCREFQKWLGSERLKVYGVSSDKKVEDFVRSSLYPVLVISYEMLVRSFQVLKKVPFDLIVCDEGHRLKNSSIKTTSLISSLPSRQRIVLTGTPVQNDLQEFFSILEFCNPGLLGSQTTFRKIYEEPILLSQQPSATPEEKTLGEARANELSRLTGLFCLRRTQEVNNQYLPPKVEKVVFCKPTSLQLALYRALLNSRMIRSCFSGQSDVNCHLACILALKKLCNHPALLFHPGKSSEDDSEVSSIAEDVLSHCPSGFTPGKVSQQDSGKLLVLGEMLKYLHSHQPKTKIVLISNYTQTLDVLETLCQSYSCNYLRLDGSTPTSKRQGLVEQFNSQYSRETVFLLSSKAGGVGLNLIGASYLVLYDIDWNPANDLQAMARVWRDGQKKKVYIYRLLTTGTIEEKIFQRQISKQGLSGAVVDSKANVAAKFSREDLKDLFCLQENVKCDTHNLLNCSCLNPMVEVEVDVPDNGPVDGPCEASERSFQLGPADKPTSCAVSCKEKNKTMDELFDWQHITSPLEEEEVDDNMLMAAERHITFIFQNETNQ